MAPSESTSTTGPAGPPHTGGRRIVRGRLLAGRAATSASAISNRRDVTTMNPPIIKASTSTFHVWLSRVPSTPSPRAATLPEHRRLADEELGPNRLIEG